MSEVQRMDLLPGEITVAKATKAQQVQYYKHSSDFSYQTVYGTLHCTNYQLHFQPDTEQPTGAKASDGPLSNPASRRSVPLGCIAQVLMVHGGRRKPLDGKSTLPKKVVEFEVLCKNLQRLVFNLKQCIRNEASSILNALARHTNPSSVHNLFSFDFSRALKFVRDDPVQDSPAPSFMNPRDWQKEIHRLGIIHDQWRVTEANKKFLICDSLCPYLVCPTNISDSMLEYAASLHQRNRLPIWVWSHPHTGVSLTRGAVTEVDDQAEAPDPNYLYAIAMARHIDHQVESKKIQQYNLTRLCGTVKDVSSAFTKMQELCSSSSSAELHSLDKRWLAGLDSSGWLGLVRVCLLQAKEAAHSLCVKRRSAMLLEEGGRDLSCVISSLVQLMVDPYYRSISGFEALIQKEWVAMGHPFTTRHGLVLDTIGYGTEEELLQAPVFLLFLDCVWQLSRQFPSALEFTESYLLHLYDLTHSCLYGNFLFNSPKNRVQASLHSKRSSFFGFGDDSIDQYNDYEGPLVSAWGRWRSTLTKEENEECLNPFYYVFGSSDALYDYSTASPIPLDTEHFKEVLGTPKVSQSSLGVAGDTFGIYRGPSPTAQLKSKDDMRDFYQLGLLLPETSMVSIQVWASFYFRYIPVLQELRQQNLRVQMLESRLVRDVRKLKDELNELELQQGCFASDLTSFIGEIVQAREREIERDRTLSIDMSFPSRPHLQAYIMELEEEMEERGREGDDEAELDSGQHVRSKLRGRDTADKKMGKIQSMPGRMSSLAQFTDALYSVEHQQDGDTGGEGGGGGDEASSGRSTPLRAEYRPLIGRSHSTSEATGRRSPVVKTRLRVTRTDSSDPVQLSLRWQTPSTVSHAERHSPLLTDRILNRKDSGVLEEGSQDELTEL